MEEQSSWSVPSWRTLTRWALSGFAAWVVLWLLWNAGTTLVPFVLGLVLAYILLPAVGWMSRYIPRWAAILVIYLLGIGAVVAAFLFVVPPAAQQIGRFFGQLPEFWDKSAKPFIDQRMDWYNKEVPEDWRQRIEEQVQNTTNNLKENASVYFTNLATTIFSGIRNVFSGLLFLAGFLVIPFWLFYVLLDAEKGKAAVDRLIPERIRADFWAMVEIVDRVFSAYIRGQLTLGLIVGMMSYAGLWAVDLIFGFDIQYKLILSMVAGFTELIPVVGPILGAIPAVIVGLFTSPMAGLTIAILYVLIQQVENNVLVPRIIGGVVNLHASVLMVLLVVSASFYGLIGVILSAPLAAILRDLYRYVRDRLRDPSDPLRLPAGALPTDPSTITDMGG